MRIITETRQSSLLLWHLVILLSFIIPNNMILTLAAPMPPIRTIESYNDTLKDFLLYINIEDVQKLAKLAEHQLDNEDIMEAKARDEYISLHSSIQPEYSDGELDEMLPIPSAVVQHEPLREGKHHNYMTLCHFKLCNMGRKRQL